VRSDIFALGVLLFQLLTGSFKQPLTPGWQRRIDDELLADDIAAATDHDPARRPASVDELVRRIEDLDKRRQKRERKRQRQEALERSQRALEQQRARRPWIWAMVGSLVVGLGLSLYLYREAEQGRQQAEAFVEKMQAVQQFLSEDIIARANPIDPLYDPEAGIVTILEDAAQQIDARFGDSPRAAAGLHRSVGNAFKTLRRDEAADSHLGKARMLYTETLGAGHPTTALVGYEQVDALVNAHDIDRARELVQQVDADAMAELQPVVRYRRYFTYARLYAELHDIPTAVEFFEQAISAYRQAELNKPVQLARLKMGLIDAYIRLAEPERAQALLDEVRTMSASEQLPADVRAFSTRSQARVYRELGDDRRALEIAEQAVREMTELYGEAHYQTITSMSLVAQMQSRLDDCEGSIATSRKVLDLMRGLYGADNASALIEQSNLGSKQFGCGRHEQGIANVRAAAEGLRQQFGDENRAVHQISFYLAKYLHQSGQHEESLAMLDHLVEVALDKTDGLAITAAEILLWRGRVLVELGKLDEARATLERAARLAEAKHVSEEIAAEIDAEFGSLTMTGEPSA
jgi:non-specific serine/threonine protein kinase